MLKYSLYSYVFQIDIDRRSRRDMSPQGRKRVAGMVSRDYQTVSGLGGQSYQVTIIIKILILKQYTSSLL